MTRRGFLSHSCSLGIASATVSSTLLSLGMVRNAAAQSAPGYRALVCVLLAGGNDSYNMLVPTDNDQFAEYSSIRSDLALPQNELLPLPGTTNNGRSYGLHPGMPELQSLFASGDVAMIANVGTLLEAYDAQAVENATASDAQAVFVDAMGTTPTLNTAFSPGNFSQSMRQIARVIGARDALGATRQTFFVNVGGWDHHDDVLDNQANMLPAVSKGLQEFRDALVEIGVFDEVTTFTTSDFGRTLTSNGKGSDHGWGGHHIVMGGSVNGASIYGDYPILSASNPLDTGRGVYAPTTSVDEYFAELARWFGVPASELDQVLPNVRNFYSPESSQAPLGFLSF